MKDRVSGAILLQCFYAVIEKVFVFDRETLQSI